LGSWPEGVPLPPKPEKPEGIADWEWDLYLDDDPTKHTALRAKYPHLRDKVEAAMGWKKDDIDDAREIAEQVLGAVSISERGHVPEENLFRYRNLIRLSQQLDSLGNQVSGMGQYGDATTLWGMSAKYSDKAQELRVDIPRKEEP
jgi:hypothetical protein